MTDEDLQRARESVLEYFSGREVNPNTVLAAYLRAAGLPASGLPWQRAKRALAAGADFHEAVAAAADLPSGAPTPVPVAPSDESTPFTGDRLCWHPKRFGPGDLDGVGAKRLLGTPDLGRVDVLVRETAQNSWDARGTSPEIEFTMNLRELDRATVGVLRDRVFTDDVPGTGLHATLECDTVWALEISDRGTVGLGGPVRNDLAVDRGEDTNFIDLVFNIGAPRDVHLGGGTYGFGKTISFVASGVGTILIWTRCEGARGPEQRLIGSAIGEGFDLNGRRYTGRHWWGNAIAHEDRVEPVIGPLAEELGGMVFARQFFPEATGTSILILDPQLGGDSRQEDVANLVNAAVKNLWPKLMADQDGRQRMRIRIQLNGEDQPLPTVDTDHTFSGHAVCLRAVRASQEERGPDAPGLIYPVTVHEVRSERPKQLLGHLALTRYPHTGGAGEASHWVTLMRNRTELVVKGLERPPLDVPGFQWAGVFKPIPDIDDWFAVAEPPAHDDWIPAGIEDRTGRRYVNIALKRIRELTDAFLRPHGAASSSEQPIQSAAAAGDALAALLGGIVGSAPGGRSFIPSGQTNDWLPRPSTPEEAVAKADDAPATSPDASATAGAGGLDRPATTGAAARPPTGRRSARPTVDVIANGFAAGDTLGWTRGWLDVQVSRSGLASVSVEVRLRVAVEGGSEEDPEAVRLLGWCDADGSHRPGPASFSSEDSQRFEFEARDDLAVDVDVRIVER